MSIHPPNAEALIASLSVTEKFFFRSISTLDDSDSDFVPVEGMLTTAAQIAHVAVTIDWFMDGAFGETGWDMNFEEHMGHAMGFKTVTTAKAELEAAFARARATIQAQPPERLADLLPADDPIFPGCTRASVLSGVDDHTAHHRGALTVYARLRGKVPPMPYM